MALDHKEWTTDYNIVLSYIVKTIKRFQEDNGASQALLQMFDSEEELNFGKKFTATFFTFSTCPHSNGKKNNEVTY